MSALLKKIFIAKLALITLLAGFASAGINYKHQFYSKTGPQNQANFHSNITFLKKNYGLNKKIPFSVEQECLIALSHFPELVDTRIEFSFSPISFTMQSRPRWDFFF